MACLVTNEENVLQLKRLAAKLYSVSISNFMRAASLLLSSGSEVSKTHLQCVDELKRDWQRHLSLMPLDPQVMIER